MWRCGRWTLVILFSIGLGWPGPAGFPQDEVDGPPAGQGYKWLLNSDAHAYLSSGALQFLDLRYGPQAGAGEEGSWPHPLDRLVNDRAQDTRPSMTTQSETTIAVFGSQVVAGWNDDGQFLSTGSFNGYGSSSDGGRNWTDRGTVPPVPGGFSFGDPDVKVDRAGTFYFASLGSRADGVSIIAVSTSHDGGRTFQPAVEASVGASNAQDFQDKEFMTVDNSGGRFDGTVYVTWTDFLADSPPGTFDQIMLSSSHDGGRHFTPAVAVTPPGSYQASMPRVGPRGELYVLYLDYDLPGFRLSKSTDGGRTFGADGLDDTPIGRFDYIGSINLNCGRRVMNGDIRTWELPTLDVNPVNGEVYVAYASNPPGPDQSDVYLIRSADGGVSWSEPLRVNDDATTADQFFSYVAVAPDGTLGISFYDRRHDPRNRKFDKYLAVSRDGGRTFEPNVRLSSVSSDVPPIEENFDPFIANCYMGDYDQLAADSQYFYSVWSDNRKQGLSWGSAPSMPAPREGFAVAGLGQAVVTVGGYRADVPHLVDTGLAQAYLTGSRRWVDLAPDPVRRGDAAAVSQGLSLYVAGGRNLPAGDILDAFERYDVWTNRWTRLAPLPTPRAGLGLARLGNKVFALGGRQCVFVGCGRALDLNEVYDVTSGRWTARAPLPVATMDPAVVALDGKVYVIGGYNLDQGGQLGAVQVYDPASDSWSQGTELPSPRSSAGAARCAASIVVFGGFTPSFGPRSSVWIYNTITDQWQPGPWLKVPRDGVQGAGTDEAIYAIGGSLDADDRLAGFNEFFNCPTMGTPHPDPDVYFQRVPLQGPVGQGSSTTAPPAAPGSGLRVSAFSLSPGRDGRPWTVSVRGQGVRRVELQVFDLGGRRVLARSGAGPRLSLPLVDARGRALANGVYLYLITARGAGGAVQSGVRKLVVLR